MKSSFAHGLAALLAVATLVPSTGCQSVYYATMEKFGVEKRDLLKRAVVNARDEQKEAQVEFKDALTRMKEMYGAQGSALESKYGKLKSDLDSCTAQAGDVRKRINDMDRVANDLFVEWEKEIGQYTNPTFASESRRQLSETRSRYSQLASALRSAESRMDPVLKSLTEHVLFLKHNLNAAAIASLKGEATQITSQIDSLLQQMNASIAEADAFIKTLQ
jgi:chromosome segregation ATPase